MSLVVARQIDDRIYIVSDTRLSIGDAGAGTGAQKLASELKGPGWGVLKTVIVNPGLCVCWAGEINAADRVFARLLDAPEYMSPEFAVQLALEQHRESHNGTEFQTEFVVATSAPTARITEIRDGIIKDGVQATYLGSQRAYSRFQNFVGGGVTVSAPAPSRAYFTAFHLGEDDYDLAHPELPKMVNALTEIAVSGEFVDVGDFVVPVRQCKDGFHYSVYGTIYTDSEPLVPKPGLQKVSFGSVAKGSYAVGCMEQVDHARRRPTIQFIQAGFEFSFHDESRGVPRAVKLDGIREPAFKLS